MSDKKTDSNARAQGEGAPGSPAAPRPEIEPAPPTPEIEPSPAPEEIPPAQPMPADPADDRPVD